MSPAESQALTELIERLAAIEAKIDEIVAFTRATEEAVAPFLTGSGGKWLALLAKSRGRR